MNFRKTKNKSPDKNSPATKKKHSYIVIGECLAGAAIVIACIGFASCSDPSPVVASATASPTASAKAVSLYDNAKDTALLDPSGKETDDKITVCSVKESDVNKSDLKDWYFNHVAKDGYKYGILKFTDAPGKGIYADSAAIYEGDLKEDTATKGYTKPADTDLIYTVNASKKTLDSAKSLNPVFLQKLLRLRILLKQRKKRKTQLQVTAARLHQVQETAAHHHPMLPNRQADLLTVLGSLLPIPARKPAHHIPFIMMQPDTMRTLQHNSGCRIVRPGMRLLWIVRLGMNRLIPDKGYTYVTILDVDKHLTV